MIFSNAQPWVLVVYIFLIFERHSQLQMMWPIHWQRRGWTLLTWLLHALILFLFVQGSLDSQSNVLALFLLNLLCIVDVLIKVLHYWTWHFYACKKAVPVLNRTGLSKKIGGLFHTQMPKKNNKENPYLQIPSINFVIFEGFIESSFFISLLKHESKFDTIVVDYLQLVHLMGKNLKFDILHYWFDFMDLDFGFMCLVSGCQGETKSVDARD